MNKTIAILPVLFLTVFLSGCGQSTEPTPETTPEETQTPIEEVLPTEKDNSISLSDIQKHNTKEDCWTAIDGKVYDISPYIALGVHKPVIVKGCGIDSSAMFARDHGESDRMLLPDYYIGELK
ncbi:cytochrome b5 domain-containing protein [Patescibacteria group bacterium]|nr:cytochrome b5 domain-containing protein [Patescibacteria group bacterium]MBU1721955.1 cytochrome b5 domain-containing protein [Patescibacteria group bacterium]MBU1901776.1 cytochrome b5 domain-containing protein [Patescibacteria group bacterium]